MQELTTAGCPTLPSGTGEIEMQKERLSRLAPVVDLSMECGGR
jgi:hypothetical protein